MSYYRRVAVHFEIEESPILLEKFKEFLRSEVITPIKRGEYGGNGNGKDCYFSGFFSPGNSKKVKKWLEKNGIKLEKPKEK